MATVVQVGRVKENGLVSHMDRANAIGAAWRGAMAVLGADPEVGEGALADLLDRYGQPHRRYHTGTHVAAVLADSADLAERLALGRPQRAVLAVAAAAHDVVYDAEPGRDERHSARWAHTWLVRAGVSADHIDAITGLVLATTDHRVAEDDLLGCALLDADLAILGADQDTYAGYVRAVRAEYASVDEPSWTLGRGRVLAGLLARDPLYRTEPGRQRWADTARRNLTAELVQLRQLGGAA
jgi:predicted metal-dependent HD superfamily phosphohydrolase